jgi:hypothetical protein
VGCACSKEKPSVTKFTTGINGIWLVSRDPYHVRFNHSSPIVDTICSRNEDLRKAIFLSDVENETFLDMYDGDTDYSLPTGWSQPFLTVGFNDSAYDDRYDEKTQVFQALGLDENGISGICLKPLAHLASQTMLGVGEFVSNSLQDHIHIGPLRIIPEKGTVSFQDKFWADGSQAWVEMVKPHWSRENFLKRYRENKKSKGVSSDTPNQPENETLSPITDEAEAVARIKKISLDSEALEKLHEAMDRTSWFSRENDQLFSFLIGLGPSTNPTFRGRR